MADYNSRYTGAEIEAAIARTDKIGEFMAIWSGTATDTPISLSSLPVNPGTGNRTGLYYIQYDTSNGTASNPTTAAIFIDNEGSSCVSASHTDMIKSGNEIQIYSNTVHYDGSSIFANYDAIGIPDSGTSWSVPDRALYIHKIWRFQLAQ